MARGLTLLYGRDVRVRGSAGALFEYDSGNAAKAGVQSSTAMLPLPPSSLRQSQLQSRATVWSHSVGCRFELGLSSARLLPQISI